jgi:hypothetical protein
VRHDLRALFGGPEAAVGVQVGGAVARVGRMDFDCHVLHIPDSDQRLVIYSAEPGSPTAQAFRRLGAATTTAEISSLSAGISAAAG